MMARILIIEDNAANLELLRYLLHAAGYEVLLARDGDEGIRVARASLPDLILSDLQLPGADGYSILRTLRQDGATAAIPVVAVTAFSMARDRELVLSAGFNGYIPKPIDPEQFVASIATFLTPRPSVT